MKQFFLVLVVAGGLAAAIAWQFGLFKDVDLTGPMHNHVDPRPTAAAQLGDPLYSQQPAPQSSLNPPREGWDPVVFPGQLIVTEKMDACAQIPGQLLFVGHEIPEGVAQVCGVAPLLQQKIYPARVDVGDGNYYKLYYRYTEGETIGEDEMIALINPAKAVHGVREANTKLVAALAEADSSEKIDREAEKRLGIEESIYNRGNSSLLELSNARLTRIKTQGEYIAKREAAKVAAIDLTKNKLILSLHYVHNKLPVKQSIIKTIYKRTGEAVKELEPVLHLYATDKFSAEGLVELQFAQRFAPGTKVIIEPIRETSPLRVWRSHKKEINAVASTHQGYAASASEDGTVCLWSEKFAGPIGLFNNRQPVRAMACSPALGKNHYLVAGLSDGTVTLWDLDKFEPGTAVKPFKEIRGKHHDAVTAIAFSPDGRYFATGSTDGSIALWDTEMDPSTEIYPYDYPFDAQHGVASPHSGQITSLHFTPQATLVSAAKDNTLRVWNLRKQGAYLEGDPIGGRSGSIGQLDVSRDGGSILFDQGKSLQILTPDGRAVATLQNPAGTVPFETLARFSPDAKLLLTAGGAEGRLQLWQAPVDGKRGFALREFVTADRASPTSAAFFDNAVDGGSPYVVSGGKDGVVYLWPLPTQNDIKNHRIENVVLTTVDQNVQQRQMRVGAEVVNEGRLMPGQPVTIVIEGQR